MCNDETYQKLPYNVQRGPAAVSHRRRLLPPLCWRCACPDDERARAVATSNPGEDGHKVGNDSVVMVARVKHQQGGRVEYV